MLLPLLFAAFAYAEPVTGYVDLHIHVAAHLAVPVYGDGPDSPPPAAFTNKHGIRPQIFTEDLAGSGPTILVSLAYANPFHTFLDNQRSMRIHIERQLDYMDAFCLRHADRFGLAHTPEEAREIIASGRTAVVHGIEGATKILRRSGDAERWASRGVAVVTPIHLADNELGGALCQPGLLVVLNIPGCIGQGLAPHRQGLSAEGRSSISALMEAGVVIDLAHTSPWAFSDTIALLTERHVAPVYTHVTARAVTDERAALTDAQIHQLYALGGLAGVTANLSSVAPRPVPEGLPATRCAGSVDDLKLQWDHISATIDGAPLAWGSDFQGGISHPRPKYGTRGCADTRPDGVALDAFDVEGLSRPGLVGSMFTHLGEAGSDLHQLDSSAERFLQIWAGARAAAKGGSASPAVAPVVEQSGVRKRQRPRIQFRSHPHHLGVRPELGGRELQGLARAPDRRQHDRSVRTKRQARVSQPRAR